MTALSYLKNSQLLPVGHNCVGSYNFFASDSKDKFNISLKEKADDWHYRYQHVEYNFNSHGYRTRNWSDIDWSESVVILGCSAVLGVGVAECETVGHVLEQKINRPVVNLGVNASSLTFSFFNSILLLNNFPAPRAVVQVWSSMGRLTNYTTTGVSHYGPWSPDHILKDNYFHSVNPNVDAFFAESASKAMWNGKSKYFSTSYFFGTYSFLKIPPIKYLDLARDDLHPGPETHKAAANLIAKYI